jgi:hypothetical protein
LAIRNDEEKDDEKVDAILSPAAAIADFGL